MDTPSQGRHGGRVTVAHSTMRRLRPRVPAGLQGLPRTFWVLWTGTLVNRLGTFVFPFLMLYLTQARHLTVATAGAVTACFGVGALPAPALSGWLADRVGRRATLVGALLAGSVTMLLLGAARSLPMLVVTAFLAGMAADAFRPASQAAVADVVPAPDRVRAYGLNFWAVNLGFAIGTSFAGFLAVHGYWVLFAGDAVTTAAHALIVLRWVPETKPEGPPHLAAEGYGRVLRDRVLLAFVALQLVSAAVYLQVEATLPLAITSAGLPTSAFGLVIALNAVLIVIVQPLVTGRLSRRRRMPLFATSAGLIGIGFGLTAFAQTAPQFAATVVVWTAGEIVAAGVAGAVVSDLAPPHLRGRYQGAYGMSFALAAVTAPLVGTRVWASVGPDALWAGCAVVGLATAATALLLGPALAARGADGGSRTAAAAPAPEEPVLRGAADSLATPPAP